jgi:hypothetical protein
MTTTLSVGQRVRLINMQRAKLEVNGTLVFDYDNSRGNTGVIEEIVTGRGTKIVLRFDAPNAGVMLVAPRYLKPAARPAKRVRVNA